MVNENIIVIPIAGKSSRFTNAGYNTPKWAIPIDKDFTIGEYAIQTARTNCRIWNGVKGYWNRDKLVLITLKEHHDNEEYKKSFFNKVLQDGDFTIVIKEPTRGMAESALLAQELYNNGKSVVFSDGDHADTTRELADKAIMYFRKNNFDGGFITFKSSDPKWSYIKKNGDLVTQVIEKSVISEDANSGFYWIKDGRDYIKYCTQMINNNDFSKNEFYISKVMQYMINDGKRLGSYETKGHISFGEPKDLEEYLKNNK